MIEKVSSKTDDEFWKAKLAEIAAERVLENRMSAVVRPHAARGRNRSRATTRATPKRRFPSLVDLAEPTRSHHD